MPGSDIGFILGFRRPTKIQYCLPVIYPQCTVGPAKVLHHPLANEGEVVHLLALVHERGGTQSALVLRTGAICTVNTGTADS